MLILLKTDKDGAEVTSTGRSFHKRGAATPKTRSPAEIAVQSTYETMLTVDAFESRRQLPTVKSQLCIR